MKESNIKIILIILFVILILLSVAGVVLYITTDMFKSSETLFKKYIIQNVKDVADVVDTSAEEEYFNYIQTNDYQEKTTASLKYLEDEDDEEEVYDITEEGVVNSSENSLYKNIKLKYGDEELSRVQLIKQNEIYGFRLANLVGQFVSFENESMSYLVSSLGYDGQFFSEKLSKITDISNILSFSDEEIETIKNTYNNAIFTDIDSSCYSTQKNAVITLNNEQIVKTDAYILTINKNQFDNIYKRILNQAVNDQVILSKLDLLDAKIKEAGFLEPEGKSVKDIYISKLQQISNSLEYKGENTSKIIITVNEVDSNVVRTSIKSEEVEYVIDLDKTAGKSVSIKKSKINGDEISTNIYVFGNQITEEGNKRIFEYTDDVQDVKMSINTTKQETGLETNLNLTYTSDKIKSINFEYNQIMKNSTEVKIPLELNEKNNILINDYEADRVRAIIGNLRGRLIQSLEKSQSNINTKLLNNILIWVDNKEKERENEEQNNIELKKQRFNNQFILYKGEELEYEHIQKLMKLISQNMSDYKVINGNKIKVFIQDGNKNEEKAKEISTAITDEHKYNVEINYSEDGYVESIDISVYNEEE